jgi:hypothetical protein
MLKRVRDIQARLPINYGMSVINLLSQCRDAPCG